jgi:hypothetical protein
VTLTVSTEAFDVIAAACDHHGNRLRALAFGLRLHMQTPAHAPEVHLALHFVAQAQRALEMTAQQCRALGARYSSGESEVSRAIMSVGHALVPVAATMNPLLYLEALAVAALAARTIPGVQAMSALVPGRVALAGLTSVGTAAGVLVSGPITVVAHPATDCLPPQGFAQLLERIPQGQSQVRIERIVENGQARAIVYIAGTRDFGLHATTDPWDMTSNMQALSETNIADSERAVRDAMAQAGIDAATPVTLVGHSQGGLIASRLAASHDFAVTDVVLAGSPSHRVLVPETIRVTAFEHSDDVIPALSGPVLAAAAATVFVRQAAPLTTATSELPAHDLAAYVGTARSIDRSTNPAVVSSAARRPESGSGSEVTCSAREYTARRQIGQATSSATTGEK